MAVTLTIDDNKLYFEASYLSDAPYDMLIAVSTLLEGAEEAVCSFQDEPGEHRWLLSKAGTAVTIRVLWFEDTFSRRSESSAQVVLVGQTDLYKLARKLRQQFNKIAAAYTPEEYKNLWGYEFPETALERLRRGLKAPITCSQLSF
jgi:hypothetical protein